MSAILAVELEHLASVEEDLRDSEADYANTQEIAHQSYARLVINRKIAEMQRELVAQLKANLEAAQ